MNFSGFGKYYYLKETESLPKLILPIGISGSGKSTWIRELFKTGKYIIVSPDNIREELTGNISDHSNEKVVWEIAEQRASQALKRGDNVILDATNVDTELRRQFVQKMPPHLTYVKIFQVSPKVAIKRIKKDIKSGVNRSNVPEDVVMNQYVKFVDTLNTIEDESVFIIRDGETIS